jgi:hypothetical protein
MSKASASAVLLTAFPKRIPNLPDGFQLWPICFGVGATVSIPARRSTTLVDVSGKYALGWPDFPCTSRRWSNKKAPAMPGLHRLTADRHEHLTQD